MLPFDEVIDDESLRISSLAVMVTLSSIVTKAPFEMIMRLKLNGSSFFETAKMN